MAGSGVEPEGLFGDIGPGAVVGVNRPAAASGVLAVGDEVRVLAGRNRGATAVIVALDEPPTPGGFTVAVARIRRPRGGESWELLGNLSTTMTTPG